MYALKRIAAYAIDMILVYSPLAALIGYGEFFIGERFSPHLRMFGMLGAWGLSMGIPIVIIGILTGLTGRSPGKFVMFLRVKDAGGDPPGIAAGIVREIAKGVSLGFFFGMIYALQGLITSGQTFYDTWLDLDVEDLKPYGLTDTQKKWRKYHRDFAKRNRQ